MNDYRKKDLGNNGDITAKVFNQKRAERDAEAESEEADKARRAAQLAALQATMDEPTAGPSKGQMVGPQIEAPVSWLKTVRAKTSGTRWHNEPGARKWHEAKSDEGHIYYWHVETNGKLKSFSEWTNIPLSTIVERGVISQIELAYNIYASCRLVQIMDNCDSLKQFG